MTAMVEALRPYEVRETRDAEGIHLEVTDGLGLGVRRTVTWEDYYLAALRGEGILIAVRAELGDDLLRLGLVVRKVRAEAQRTGITRIKLEGGPADGQQHDVPVGAEWLPPLTFSVYQLPDWTSIFATGDTTAVTMTREVVYHLDGSVPDLDGLWRYRPEARLIHSEP